MPATDRQTGATGALRWTRRIRASALPFHPARDSVARGVRSHAMHFPEVPRADDDNVLDRAVSRREEAREGYERLSGLAAAAVGTPAQRESADLRDAACARLAASNAWVGWIRHGV